MRSQIYFSHLGPRNQPLTVILPTKKIFKSQVGQLGKGKFKFTSYIFIHLPSKWSEITGLAVQRSFQKNHWPLRRQLSLCGWLDGLTADSGYRGWETFRYPSTRIKTCNFAGHLQMTLAEGQKYRAKHWGIKKMNQPTVTWQPHLYLECYMIMHED